MRKRIGKIKKISDERKCRRKLSIRAKVIGKTDAPRVCVIKTNKHISVQVVDDSLGKTLFSLHTFGKNAVPGAKKSVSGAAVVGASLAEELKRRNISNVVFDRNGLPFKGIIASVAKGIRDNGIKI
ncbi:MAG: 50S ribosomal protein L18 [Oligoflexia bacterium]|nr:50S ribosomal protein L18 [Oligoflexia bacterium]